MENSEVIKPQGIILVDKPKEWTSFDVVNKIRGTLAREIGIKPKHLKVGHSGTLDPLATGLLVIAVGKATKQMPTLIKQDKVYIVSAILGATSTTGDAEGEKKHHEDLEPPSKQDIDTVLSRFEGKIEQIPPSFSAIKINGQRAYKLAREGKEVKLEPRQVTINKISDVSYEWPNLKFTADVSSGTYIRSLVEDIGSALETGAYMSDLERASIGERLLSDAIEVSKETTAKELLENLVSLDL